MTFTVISALLIALISYAAIGLAVGRGTKAVADLLPLSATHLARIDNPAEFSTSTIATTISLATVIIAFFELARDLGLWLLWTVMTTAAGLVFVCAFARKIWERMSAYDHRPTLHEFLGKEFGSPVLLRVGAICTSLGFLGALAVELTVGSRFFAGLITDVPALIVVAMLCLVSFFYTAVGGFRAVIVTTRIQMISIWMLLLALPVFYIYYVVTHGGWQQGLAKIPPGVLDFAYTEELLPFLVGIFLINVPTFIADMSIWQRIAATQQGRTVTAGLGRSAIGAAVTWAVLALLACFVFMIVPAPQSENPLVSLLKVIGSTRGFLARVILFVTVTGLYGAMLSTASTQLIAVSHTLYADVFQRSGKDRVHIEHPSKRELNISRAILLFAALVSTVLVQLLSSVGFSIADMVFAIYGAQLGICPVAILALVWDRRRLKNLSVWAAAAVSVGFIAGWAAAVYGRLTRNTDLVFLSPVFSLAASLSFLGLGVVADKTAAVCSKSVNLLLLRSVIKARRNCLYHFVPLTKPIGFVCLKDKCARCCRVIGTPVVTPDEARMIGDMFLVTDGDTAFVKSDNCVCTLLADGLCSIYPLRPKGCREYPWYNIDGRLYYDVGCPGLRYDRDDRPTLDDIQPFDNFFPHTPRLIVRLIKKICIKK